MAEQLLKLSPDRDLQCYFFMPSAIAALSKATPNGFTLSGKWRQQQDWAVVEWNVNNTFEHPSLRYLPDGDLSGLTLTYEESRTNCIPFESNVYPVVDWPNLRIWFEGQADPVAISLWPNYVTPVYGSHVAASGEMTLSASPGVGNRVGLALLDKSYSYTVAASDGLSEIAAGIAASFPADGDFSAMSAGSSVIVTWKSTGKWTQLGGANGNRISMYGFSQNPDSCWEQPFALFSGGTFPATYKVSIDFGALQRSYATDRIRKMRWTWAADLQPASFEQTEFSVVVSNWQVTGNNREHSLAGPQSRRVENTDAAVVFNGNVNVQAGNYSGSRISELLTSGSSVTLSYSETSEHDLYFGTRLFANAANVSVLLDGQPLPNVTPQLPDEDTLARFKIATLAGGEHTITLSHAGDNDQSFWFDFFDIVYPTLNLPEVAPNTQLALATDWDTYHSQSLPPERTAWLIQKLGFHGRVNHYVGALWFYELVRTGAQYATQTFTCSASAGTPGIIQVWITPTEDAPSAGTAPDLQHSILPDDTAATIVQALTALVNIGTNLVWASALGTSLTLTARNMGTAGNGVTLHFAGSTPNGVSFVSNLTSLSGGIDGTDYPPEVRGQYAGTLTGMASKWRTDLTATPRINKAARDWHAAYFTALKAYGIDCVAAFSTELMNGDPSIAAGIAQRYPDGTSVIVSTPAIQTNFSPQSLAFWEQVYLDMAQLQSDAGLIPYLQSGEVQWWYFSNPSGMPLFDSYTLQQFQSRYGQAMQAIPTNEADPAAYRDECSLASSLIANYTASIRNSLKSQFPECRYEILYPTDTNNTSLNTAINFAVTDWTPANLTCLKTESFTFTNQYDLDSSTYSIGVSAQHGFSSAARSHLVGISDSLSAWMKEVDIAISQGLESVVLFALDQYCLIGYPAPPFQMQRRSSRQG